MKKSNLSIGAIIILLIAAFLGLDLSPQKDSSNSNTVNQQELKNDASAEDKSNRHQGVEQIAAAFQNKQSNVQVRASGKVKVILADDNDGSRHQKFILSLDNGLTVLIAHNIDLAPRIKNIQKGDTVEFYGEYEYTEKGGVIHWTHHDPQNRHVGGWLKHEGRTYQ